MNQIQLDDPCVLFAVRRESLFFRREFRPHLHFAEAPCWAWFCGPAWLSVLVLETGVGPSAVAPALDWLLRGPKWNGVPVRPRVLLFAGFAGALDASLTVGDMLLADEVCDAEGRRWLTTWPGPLPAGRWEPALHRGRLLSTPTLVATPDEKRRLGERHQARAVDMESALFAERCTRAGVPFGCVRAVSDDVQTPLSPALVPLLAGGRVSPVRLLTALLRQPSLLGELLRLGRSTKVAARQLSLALGELLTLTLPWADDRREDG